MCEQLKLYLSRSMINDDERVEEENDDIKLKIEPRIVKDAWYISKYGRAERTKKENAIML